MPYQPKHNLDNPFQSQSSVNVQIILNLSILFFSSVALIQHYLGKVNVFDIFSGKIMLVALIIFLFVSLYSLWALASKILKSHHAKLRMANIGIFFIICTFTICMTGLDQSSYKYLLLLITIAATIEGQIKLGLIATACSSVFLLSIDMMFFKPLGDGTINMAFENDLILSCVLLIVTYTVGHYIKEQDSSITKLNALVIHDELTNLYNHRYFIAQIDKYCKKAAEDNNIVSLILIDIDKFKQYNDVYGHEHGNDVLKHSSKMVKEWFAAYGICSRYGGDEFAVLLPNTDATTALELAEMFCRKFEREEFGGEQYLSDKQLTISAGVASYPTHASDTNTLIKRTDDALYRAKFLRRNRAEIYVSFIDEFEQYTSSLELQELWPTIKTLIAVINSRDKYTYMHTDRVFRYCRLFGEYLNLPENDIQLLVQSAYIHDIGKINIATNILLKVDKLTDDEFKEIQSHPKVGADMIRHFNSMAPVINIIEQHHERYDGSGYPLGIKGDAIVYHARILSVIDSYDAMSSDRPYKPAKSHDESILELRRCSGSQFDPFIADKFIDFLGTVSL